ncbi:MAG: hypothetical protein ACK4QW_07790 [Alphaproteobacteria bacterium]
MKYLFFIFSLVFSVAAEARSTLNVCNEGRRDLRLAAIFNDTASGRAQWIAMGWQALKVGECRDMFEVATGSLDLYLSVRSVYRHIGERISHYDLPAAPILRDFQRGRRSTLIIEDFFCVRDEDFKRLVSALSDHAVCPAGYFLQLFSTRVRVPARTRLTFRLS